MNKIAVVKRSKITKAKTLNERELNGLYLKRISGNYEVGEESVINDKISKSTLKSNLKE